MRDEQDDAEAKRSPGETVYAAGVQHCALLEHTARRKGGDMGKPGRQANFELLRIIAMFMVVILHWNTNSGLLLDVGSPVTGAGVWSLVTESVCIVAVNVYVLISGYFLSSCTFSFRRVAQVLVQTLFYTVLIPPVLALVGVLPWSEVSNPYHIWNSIFRCSPDITGS